MGSECAFKVESGVTDWELIAIRIALHADLMLLVGLAAFPLYSRACDPASGRYPRMACRGRVAILIPGICNCVRRDD